MNINILKNLEHLKLFEYYYVYQDCILGTASLILIISLLIIIVLKLNYKNLWESVAELQSEVLVCKIKFLGADFG